MKSSILYCLSVFFIFFNTLILAQEKVLNPIEDTNQFYSIILRNGSIYAGKIITDDARELLIESTSVGRIYLKKSDIKLIKVITETGEVVEKDYKIIGPFTTRHHLTTNAFPVKKGENYMAIQLYGPEFHFSVANRFSIGVMTTWIMSPIALSMKYTLPTNLKNLHFSLGSINGSSGYLNLSRGYLGLHWATITFGKRGKNISFSGGYGYFDFGFLPPKPMKQAATFSLAGIVQISKKAIFVFDNIIAFGKQKDTYTGYENGVYYKNEEIGSKVSILLMPGFRIQSSERKAIQISLAGIIEWRENGFKNGAIGIGNTGNGKVSAIPIPMVTWYIKL